LFFPSIAFDAFRDPGGLLSLKLVKLKKTRHSH